MVRGDLSVFPFLSVMQMLLTSGRAGRLAVDHPRGGHLWIEKGEIVHAETRALKGEHALQVMSSLDSGVFTFEPDLDAPARTLSLKRETALRRLLEEQESWATLLRVFPDWTQVLRFTAKWSPNQPVTRPQFRALSLVEQRLNIQSLLEHSGEAPRGVLDTLRPFLMAGLIEQG